MAGDKNINIGVGADVSGLKTGMNDAAKIVQDAGTKMQTAAKDATTKTEQSFSNLRQAYRATARDAYEIALSQGTNSAAFLEASQKAGKFKDELDLVNNKIKAFSSDTPVLTSALGVGQGLAGGFAAAQGAMALFGNTSKEVEQALLKVQGAMALLQGLQAIGQLGDSMSTFALTINTKVLPALMTMKGAMIATGIGAFAIAVGFLAGKFIEVKEKNDAATAAEKRYKDEMALAKKAVDDKVGSLNLEIIAIKNKTSLAGASLIQAKAEKAALEEQIEAVNKYNTELEKTGNTRFANGKSALLDAEVHKKNLEKKKLEIVGLELIAKKTKELEDAQKAQAAAEAKINENKKTKVDTKSNFGDLKNVIKFNPVVEFDPTVIDDISDLIIDSSEQIAESLDGMFSPLDQNLTNMELKLAEFKDQVEEILIQGLGNAFAEFGRIAGANLAGANESVGAAAEAMIGSLAATIGAGMIALGVPMLFAMATAGEGAALIAGGVALNVLAGALGESSKGGGGSKSPPSRDNNYSPNNSFSGFTPVANDYSMTSRLIGTDLLLSVEKSAKKMERVR